MLADRLGYLLKHAQSAFAERSAAALAPLGLTGRELAVLTVLGGSEALAQQQAASRLGVDRTTMVALVDALEAKGLVRRGPDPVDRRRNLVHLTERGRELLDEGSRIHAEAERTFLAALTADEVSQLKSLLRRALEVR
ncbi:MarR family transcriptional regulator [Paractinoplanes ferrugineus]|uniref:MarR family transcriptional regulator n=1 Tax=Paractinoplanes ferrugineus TaxID=113564 RepID=A0A919M6S1_9ACTN|nr:MarR family transcriptional regulator [Actinoplanes ferrugineus]GIE08641.1 MarR family transcriptional regulator [Actinoplanes ferrugineus]